MDENMVRICSGINGLDEMIEGGFPFPSVILVSGSAGTGKTTFAQKFLFSGAKMGQIGLYFTTLSEPTQWMLRYSSKFKFINPTFFGKEIIYSDLGGMIRDAKAEDILSAIDEKIAEVMPQRVVIDPITVVGQMMKKDYRTFLFDLVNRLKNWQATTILTGEVRPGEIYPAEVAYAVDGVILLVMSEEADARRKYLEVLKMRGTDHLTGKQSIDITTDKGIVILRAKF
jgi:circadian clock protein KaiC